MDISPRLIYAQRSLLGIPSLRLHNMVLCRTNDGTIGPECV